MLVQAMTQAVPSGSQGAYPLDYDGVKFKILGLDGDFYEIEIEINRKQDSTAHLAEMSAFDLSKVVAASYKQDSLHALHAVIKAKLKTIWDTGIDYKRYIVYRNSGEQSQELFTVDENTKNGLHSSYSLCIHKLVKKGYNCPDTCLIQDATWVY